MVAGGLGSLLKEVEGQPQALRDFSLSEIPFVGKGAVFVGAGDSYAAALAGFYATGGGCIAFDPYGLASRPEVARGREVCFISVSGRTKSNLLGARRVRGLARGMVVVTADASSELAKAGDEVVKLPMDYVPRTPGFLSFSLSLLAVLRMSGWSARGDFRKALTDAKKDRGKAATARGTTYFLGNLLGYPVALYAAAKQYEILGTRAHAELLEEFSHMEVLSLGKDDAVNIISCFDPSRLSERLAEALGKAGYRANVIPSRGATEAERLFHSVFVSQYAVLDGAARSGLKEPKFLSAGERLRASDSLIY